MADITSTITTPEGRQYRITHPADATDDQIKQYVSDQLQQAEPERKYPAAVVERPKPESFIQGAVEGAAKPINNAARFLEFGADKLGIAAPLRSASSYLGMSPTANQAADVQANYFDNLPTQGSGLGRFAGEAAATLPLAALPGGVVAQGAAGGALLTDARDPTNIAIDAAKGAGGALLGAGFINGGRAFLNPNVSGDVRTLLGAGIRPTTGQIAGSVDPGELQGGGGIFKRGEDIAAKVPVAGAMVSNAQYRATQDLNRAVANRALRPIGQRAPADIPVGHDLVRHVGDQLSQAYNDVLPTLNGQADQAFHRRISAITARADLPPGYEEQTQNVLNEALKAFRPRNPNVGGNSVITPDQFSQLPPTQWEFNGRRLRDASERLGDIGSAYRASDDPYMRILGDVAQQSRDQLHALARRQNPDSAQRLRDIDRGYASLVRMERAAGGTADGVFTPRQYDSATRMTDRSARRRQSARGLALDQDLSGAASRVMANGAAQGGSKDVNSLVALALLGGKAASGDGAAIAGLGGVLGGSAAYSQPGQAALRYLMTRQAGPNSQRAADFLGQLSPYAAAAAPATIDQFP